VFVVANPIMMRLHFHLKKGVFHLLQMGFFCALIWQDQQEMHQQLEKSVTKGCYVSALRLI
jgi:hypothetical protein